MVGGRKSVATNPRDAFQGGEIVSGPRQSRAKRAIVEESASDDDDELDAEGEEDEEVVAVAQPRVVTRGKPPPGKYQEVDEDEDEDDEEDDEEEEEDEEEDLGDEEDAEGESDIDGDGDVYMESTAPPPPPIIKMTGPSSKPNVTITPASEGKLKSVEEKEMQMADDNSEELSDLESEAAGNDTTMNLDEDQDMDEEDDEDEDAEGESDDEEGNPVAASRDGSPDVSKMTKRQRGRHDLGNDFLQLPMEPQIKKHLTAEEHAMRRAEMARRRKNLSEKRNEEEKMDTINRLLKKQAPKRRGKLSNAEITAGVGPSPLQEQTSVDAEVEKADPIFIRWVSNKHGSRLGVPSEWDGTPVGRIFEGGKGFPRRMVEEIEG
ncbi:hypothetical protein MMC25_002758 [Agyrium rufum]|nr:hypothetical protein [Agyrium rufum]